MSPGNIELTHPEWLWLLPVLLVVLWLWQRFGRHDEHTGLSAAAPFSNLRFLHPLVPFLSRQHLARRSSVLLYLGYSLVLTCLVIALSGPVRIGQQLPDPPQERDIYFIVDTSVSMVLRDYVLDEQRIDRMSMLKGLLDRFVQQLKGDRISIIVFGDDAYTLVPPSRDQTLVRNMLARIQVTMAGRSSAVGDGVALAVKEAQAQPARRQVLVLLTDADQPSGKITPLAAAELANNAGLPLYTIAIGAGSYAAEEQRISGLIYHPADLQLLQALAERTGARSYQAGDSETLQQALDEIERREKTTVKVEPRYYRQPLYAWPLLLGLVLISLGQLRRLVSVKEAA